jgi:hypothetical protein
MALVKCQHMSNATQGIIGKFQRPNEGLHVIGKIINLNVYEIHDEKGKPRGLFHLHHMKPYLQVCEEW